MRLTTEKALNDIETYLEETAELPWGTAHIILMEAQDQINSLQRQLDYKELTDEEIMAISETFEDRFVDTEQQWSACILDFARAILRKAKE